MDLINNTPIEKYTIGGYPVFVKREDLCCPPPGPPFSKVRGLLPVLKRLKSLKKPPVIGYTETSISMAGWCVAWMCSLLGLKAVIFDPQYKKTPPILKYHRKQWDLFNPDIIPIKAGRAKVNWYISRKMLLEKYPNSYLLPLGLILPETIEATKKEAANTILNSQINYQTLVVNVGSGTILAGLINPFRGCTIYGIMGRSGNVAQKKKNILKKIGLWESSKHTFFGINNLHLIDSGWNYTDRSYTDCPFPSHPHYDLKAWEWLQNNIYKLKPPVLFWNIGKMERN